VTVRPVGTDIQFVVRDHGSGLADGRGRRSDAAARARSGMGLSISRGLLSAEGGRVWGENHPDGGAVFTIAVPAECRRAAQLEPESDVP
jgi:signal transduction histidine kinase